MYLSPDLETLPQRCVSYVVAHEFAHVALGHFGQDFRYADTSWVDRHDERPEEVAADNLVCAWGYSSEDNPVHIDAEVRRLEAEAEDLRIAKEVEAEQQRSVDEWNRRHSV